MKKRTFVRLAPPLLLFAAMPLSLQLATQSDALAAGEQNARLRGMVYEAGTKVPVPGARVEIRSDAMIGGARSFITDDNGRFDFLSIPPGRYDVTVVLEGVRPIRRRVNVQLGQTQDMDIPFSAELTQVETTTIREDSTRLNPDRTSTGVVLTAEQQAKIASPRRYQDVVQQAPGVTGGANPVVAGATFRHNRYLVDGLDVTDPVTNTFSANFNFDAISQIEALTVPMDARYNALGGVINLITKRGSNRFQIDSSFYINHQDLSAGARAGTRPYEGRLLDQNEPRPPSAIYQANLNLGGPLVKDKLWFYFSFEYRYELSSIPPGPPLNVQHASRYSNRFLPRLKLTWAPTPRQRVELSLNSDPAFFNNLRQTNAYADVSEYAQRQGGMFATVNYDWFVTDHLIFSLQTGYIFQNLRITPQNGDLVNSAHSDRASTIIHNAADANRNQDDQRHRFQFDPMLTWTKSGFLGSHTITAGVQFNYLRHYQLFSTPGNLIFTDDTNQATDAGALVRDPSSRGDLPFACNPLQPYPREGVPASPCFRVTQYEPVQALVRTGWSLGGFVQDIWKPTSWLTLVPGMRIDYGTFSNSLGQVVQNLLGFGPRFGMTLRLTKDGKTLLKGNYGRSNEVSTLLFAASADTGAYSSQWNYNRDTRRFDRFFTSAGGAEGYDLRGRCQDGSFSLECGNARLSLTPPRTDSVTASIERELYTNVIGTISYTFRQHSFLWEDIELNSYRTLDGGDYAGFGDPSKGDVYAYRPTKDAMRTYHGIDFTLGKFASGNAGWSAFVAYTLSFLYGTVDDQISALRDDPPRDFRFNGYLGDDHRHQIKAQASYTWRGLTAGGTLFYITGAPITPLYLQALGQVGRFGWRGVDPGSDPNDIRKWTEMRCPDVLDVNIRAQYDLHELVRQHITVIVDLFNAIDLSTPVTRQGVALAWGCALENRNAGVRTAASTFGTVTDRQTPFRAQFGIRYQF